MKLRASSDLPEYLRSKFTEVVPRTRPKQLHYKPVLKQTVSPEAPSFFRVQSIPVLTSAQQAQVKLGPLYDQRLAHGGRKSQQLGWRRKFNYEDLRDSQYSLTLARIGDLRTNQVANGSHEGFRTAYSAQLHAGFSIQRGECSRVADHIKLTRPLKPRLDYLKFSLGRQLGKSLARKT